MTSKSLNLLGGLNVEKYISVYLFTQMAKNININNQHVINRGPESMGLAYAIVSEKLSCFQIYTHTVCGERKKMYLQI